MHKKMVAASSLFSELAHALRRSMRDEQEQQQQQEQPSSDGDDEDASSPGPRLPLRNKRLLPLVTPQNSRDELFRLEMPEDETTDTMIKPAVKKNNVGAGGVTDIHPELTLAQIKNPPPPSAGSGRFRAKSRGAKVCETCGGASSFDRGPLEINTMFDFHSTGSAGTSRPTMATARPPGSNPRGCCHHTHGGGGGRPGLPLPVKGGRRSSVAVMAGGAKQQRSELQRRSRQQQYLLSLNPEADVGEDGEERGLHIQSSSAVHYLAISPPRIRITDDKGSVSPDMYGRRHSTHHQGAASTSKSTSDLRPNSRTSMAVSLSSGLADNNSDNTSANNSRSRESVGSSTSTTSKSPRKNDSLEDEAEADQDADLDLSMEEAEQEHNVGELVEFNKKEQQQEKEIAGSSSGRRRSSSSTTTSTGSSSSTTSGPILSRTASECSRRSSQDTISNFSRSGWSCNSTRSR